MTAFAALCLFVVGWFKGLLNPDACDGPARYKVEENENQKKRDY